MATPLDPDENPPSRPAPHVTCLACGCLCDDIAVAVAANRVAVAERACSAGLSWFQRPDPNEGHPAATIEGRAAELDEALGRAAAILRAARSPAIWGLTHSSIEAVGEALGLADRLGATVDLAGWHRRESRHAALIRAGEVSATLGEVKDRAEVVLFWGMHPDGSHPRHTERYSVRPLGRFLAEPRTVICVDVGPILTPDASDPGRVGSADVRLALSHDQQGPALAVLQASARGVRLDPERTERATGHPPGVWDDLLARFAAARYGAIFFAPPADRLDAAGWDAALGLVRALNRDGRRCVGLGLGEAGNVAGASAVCTWQAGAPGALDFAAGFPRHLPGEATLADRLDRGEVDALLAVGLDPSAAWARSPRAPLGGRPAVWIAPGATARRGDGWVPTVAIAAGRLGLEAGGTVGRVDGVMLPLRPPLAGSRPADLAVLQGLARRLAAGG